MKQTRLLQEIEIIRFEELYDSLQSKRLTQSEAALVLGVCARTFRCYIYNYEADGIEGLIDKGIDQPPHKAACTKEICSLQDQYRAEFMG